MGSAYRLALPRAIIMSSTSAPAFE